MCEEENNMERIANAIISYLKLKLKIKTIKEDEEIKLVQNENGVPTNRLYILREFNTECYIIEKVYFNEFCSAINFNDLTLTLDISNEISKNLFIKDFINYFKKKPYLPIHKNIKIYSNLEEMKQIAQHFNDYELVNEDILCYGMGVSPSLLEGKMMKVSKNKENTCLMSVSNNFTFIINNSKNEDIKKKDEINNIDINQKSINNENKINDNDIKENKENNDNNENENNKSDKYKNLYYVEDLTKKIFILLYLNEQKIKKKLKKEINDVYKFKKYYLIRKGWLKKYKEFFLYDLVIKKFKEEYKKEYNYEGNNEQNNNEDNDNNEIYSYDIANINLNNIVKNIGQISLFNETIISDKIRDAKRLIPKKKKILTKKK